MWVAFVFSKKKKKKKKKISIFAYYVNFNESLTNDIVSFEQLGPEDLLRRSI